MKVYPPEFNPNDSGPHALIPLVGQDLIACDHCGQVAVDTPRFGWQRWTDENEVQRHHCAAAAEYNEWVRNSLVHNVAPESAIEYEEWPDPDAPEPPKVISAAEYMESIRVPGQQLLQDPEYAKPRSEAAHGYATEPAPDVENPTAATDADFGPQGDWRTRTTDEYEHLSQMVVPDNPIFPPVAQGDSAVAGTVHEAEQWESEREREDYGPNGPGGHI